MSRSPVGELFHARDGGLAVPMDTAAVNYVKAQAADAPSRMEVRGVAVRMGVVGHFWMGALRLEPGSIVAPKKDYRYRDVLGLYSHDTAAVLARVGANTMDVQYGENEITYSMRLNPADRMAADVWARLVRGDLNSASIGFVPIDGEWVEGVSDNSLDAEGERVDVFAVTEAVLLEVSVVAQGAFQYATSYPAAAEPVPVGAVATAAVTGVPVGAFIDDVGGAVMAELPLTGDDDIVGADGTGQSDDEAPGEGASVDGSEGDPGDEPPGGTAVDGGTKSDVGPPGGGAAGGDARAGSADWIADQLAEMRKRRIDLPS